MSPAASEKRKRRRSRDDDEENGSSVRGRRRKRNSRANRQKQQQVRELLQEATSEPIEPVPVTAAYRLGLFFVGGAMILLPIVYVALIVLLGVGLFWYGSQIGAFLHDPFVALFCYALPMLTGVSILFFMIKTLFVGNAEQQKPKRIKRDAEPLLYEYVEYICDCVGAPAPKSIRIINDVNAAAGFRNGIWSLFSRDMVLIIGLPLVYGLTLRQLSGVLAHELGHFAQKSGMRLGFIITVINNWFAGHVYEPDVWDLRLHRLREERGLLVKVLLYPVTLGVFIARCILWALMICGRFISCYLARQKEFDADLYEARFAGSKSFATGARRLTALNVAQELALRDLGEFMRDGRLVDNLPQLVASNIDQITPELKDAIREYEQKQETRIFDTHPGNNERIEAVQDEPEMGVFRLPESLERLRATVLFEDVDRLGRFATLDTYFMHLGPQIDEDALHSVEDLIERRSAEEEAAKALHRYFQVPMNPWFAFPIAADAHAEVDDLKKTAKSVKRARDEMLKALPEYKDLIDRFEHAEDALFRTTAAVNMLEAGVAIRGKDYGLPGNSRKLARNHRKNASKAHEHLASRMLTFEEAAGERLSSALRLLTHEKVVANVEGGKQLNEDIVPLVPEARFLSGCVGELPELRTLCHSLVDLFSNIKGHEEDQRFIETLFTTVGEANIRLESLYDRLKGHDYPLDHADGVIPMREYALPDLPDPRDVSGLLYLAQSAAERLIIVQMRVFARLAQAAEKIESALGLEPLPEPAEEESRNGKAKKKRRRR